MVSDRKSDLVQNQVKSFSLEQLAGAESLILHGLGLYPGDTLLLLYQNEFSRAAYCIGLTAKSHRVVVDSRPFSIEDFPLGCSVSDLSSPTIPAGIVLLIEWSEVSNKARLGLLAELVDVNLGWRIASMPGVNLEELSLCVCDFDDIKEKCDVVFALLARSRVAVIETQNPYGGTDILRVPLDAFRPENSTGLIARNSWGNFPSGETFIMPNPYQSEGWLTVRGSISGRPLLASEWIRFQLDKGRIVYDSLEGSSSELWQQFRAFFFKPDGSLKDENANALAELGVGTNSHINRLTGNPIFDEKKLGSVHVSFGRNDQFKGPLSSGIYQAVVCEDVTLTLEGNIGTLSTLVRAGELQAVRSEAIPQLELFGTSLHQDRTVTLGSVECEFHDNRGATRELQMSIEYVSERENVRIVVARGKTAELARRFIDTVSDVNEMTVEELLETIDVEDRDLGFNIVGGMAAYGVLRTATRNVES